MTRLHKVAEPSQPVFLTRDTRSPDTTGGRGCGCTVASRATANFLAKVGVEGSNPFARSKT
jgi:hypothetical protein